MIFLDLETTGFDPKKDKIIEFAAVKINEFYEVENTLEFLVNPECDIPKQVSQITNIFTDNVKDEKIFTERVTDVANFIQDDLILGHNIQFDISFLQEYGLLKNNKFIDTCDLATMVFSGQKSYSLEVLSDVLQIEHQYKHRALGDVLACLDLVKIIKTEFNKLPLSFWQEIEKYQNIKSNTLSFILKLKDKNNDLKNLENFQIKSQCKKLKIKETSFESKWWQTNLQMADFAQLVQVLMSQTSKQMIFSVPEKFLYFIADNITNKQQIVIYPCEEYLSAKSLEKFLAKQEYTEEEVVILIKILKNISLNLDLTKRNLNIHWKDQTIWQQLCSTPVENKEKVEFILQKKEQSTIFVSHLTVLKEYNALSEKQSIVFFDFTEDYLDKIFSGIIYQKYLEKIIKDSTLKNELKEKFTLLENYLKSWAEISNKDLNNNIFKEEIADKSEFLEIKKSVLELAEKMYQTKELQKYAGILQKFFNNDLAIRSLRVLGENNLMLSVYPLNYKNLLKSNDNHTFINLASAINKNFSFYNNLFDLNQKKEISFPKNNINIHLPEKSFPIFKDPAFFDRAKEQIEKIITKKNKTLILCTAKKQIENLFLHFSLDENLNEKYKFIAEGFSGGRGKIIHFLENNNKSILFCTAKMAEELAWQQIEFEIVIVLKLSFPSVYHPVIIARKKAYDNDFNDYYLPKTILNLQRTLRFLSFQDLYFLDKSVEKSWAQGFLEIFN